MIEKIQIFNYKSIRELSLPLNRLNVLIGSNGVGKSNFISFFELIEAIYHKRLGNYTMQKDMNNLLHHGKKVSPWIAGLLDFNNTNAFFFQLESTDSPKGYLKYTGDFFNTYSHQDKQYSKNWHKNIWDNNVEESEIIDRKYGRAGYIKHYLESFTVYHFEDTSNTSALRNGSRINDNEKLKNNGDNLASILYKIQQNNPKSFKLIEGVIKSIAPYFKRFNLKTNPLNDTIHLVWEEENSSMYLDAYNFSDGTLRFIALTTLLLQPDPPEIIIIDEPELGLHPAAINKLAALIKRYSLNHQIIISTQSTNLVNCFDVNDIIVVDRKDNQSVFEHLSSDDLQVWLDDYSLSDLWEKNLIGGQL